MSDKYFQLKISADTQVNDLVVGFLSNVGAEGFVEEGRVLVCYFSEDRWKPSFESDVTGFLNSLKGQGKISKFDVSVTTIRNQDWNKQWEESIVPVEVTENIVIKPSWKEYVGPAKIVIEIDPKMSFGTGHHETTRMMVQELERCIKGNERVLDVGTGTGVLAIAAIKLGAEFCVAVDNDTWSIGNSRENIERNGVADKIRLVKGEIESVQEDGFDIVAANLNRNTLIYIREDLYRKCRSGGFLLLAGVLTADEQDVTDYYGQVGFKLLDTRREAEWSALVLTK
ncbi:MAG: 50S ribosomal protein L11 methyltransferase [Bacteroidetes bacterium]|nr:50S ribosomal protein L11 methyltransferase [Bacteroidota bacterium]